MKKSVIFLLVATLLAPSLFACGKKQEPLLSKDVEVFEKVNFNLETPAAEIDRVDFVQGLNTGHNMLSAIVLQGLVNKTRPRVYVTAPWSSMGVDVEAKRQEILQVYGDVALKTLPLDASPAHKTATAFWTIFNKYKDEVERMFVFPSELKFNDAINVAAMLAGRNKGIAVSPLLADQLEAEGYTLPRVNVLEYMNLSGKDAAGKDKANYLTINNWIADNMVAGSNRTIVYIAVPRYREQGGEFLPNYYDLAVATDGLIYNAGYDFLEAGEAYQKKILDQFPDCTPVCGWADMAMEGVFVHTLSKAGKFLLAIDWGYGNGSVFGAFPEYSRETPVNGEMPASYEAENGKIYAAFVMSDGDAWHFTAGSNIGNFAWRQQGYAAAGGDFPMGWSFDCTFAVCNPLIMRWYYETKSPRDNFIQAASGISYIYASKMPERSRENFLKISALELKKAGLDVMEYWDLDKAGQGGRANELVGDDYGVIARYADVIKPQAMFRGHNSLTGNYEFVNGMLTIEKLGNWFAKDGIESYGGVDTPDEIVKVLEHFRAQKLAADKPLFLLFDVDAWGVGVSMVPDAIGAIRAGAHSSAYEFVTPNQLIAGIKTYESKKS
ncbi:MAG: hypothetical protein LBL66_09530 [Clostridiales bacterium]|jgi:hypothetical protein|nr:hypothetical protein [Clostridiales bacterium]